LKIASSRHWLVHLPFATDVVWGGGRRGGTTRLVVELTTESGVVGYGETICLLDFIEPVLTQVVLPLAIGRSVTEVEKLHRHVLGAGYYHHKRAAVMALAAVEMAMWDALGRSLGVPLHALWGGLYRSEVEVAAFLAAGPAEQIAERATQSKALGYKAFKVKLGLSEASDIETVRAARTAIGSELALRGDVNGAWTPGTAKRQLARLLDFNLSYVEQPLELSDLEGHALLRNSQAIPIALDESAYDLTDVGNILRAGAADVVLLDPHEAGGLWPCIKAAAVCEASGIPVTLHSGGELGFSQAALLHLGGSIPNLSIPIDSESAYLADDVVTDATRPRVEGGTMKVPLGPGLGVDVDVDKLEHYRVDTVPMAYLDPQRAGWFAEKPAY
jgi:L-rhamnonate dehydratase